MLSRKFQAGAIYFALKPGSVGDRNGKIEDVVNVYKSLFQTGSLDHILVILLWRSYGYL